MKRTRPTVREEFDGADLGDRRLNARLDAIVERAICAPGASFPKMMPTVAEREALYRFVENERVDWRAVAAPHALASAERSRAAGVVRVAHDTSWFVFDGERAGLGPVSSRGDKRGFAAHVALAISGDARRAPLGVLALASFVRDDNPVAHSRAARAAKKVVSRTVPRADRQSARWLAGVQAAEARIGPDTVVIHVMDQEADNYALFADLIAARTRFVIRGEAARSLDAYNQRSVGDALAAVTASAFRTVPLGSRARTKPQHPARRERTATLQIRGLAVKLPRPSTAHGTPQSLYLNIVHVFEPSPPPGEAPVDWTLYTTEAIGSMAELTAVVDHYRARWRIEEFFKALKTGCAIEQRQLESYAALLRALAFLVPLAWHLLALRTLAHDDPTAPASTVVDALQLDVLRALAATPLPPQPTVAEILRALAELGGHIRQNGAPGWLVLGRGYEDFVKAERVWRMAVERTK